MDISAFITTLSQNIWTLPSLLMIAFVSIFITVQLKFVQIAHLKDAIKILFKPHKGSDHVDASGDLSPFQAFMNTLGASIGNGSLAGIPVAIAVGGPGSIFWLLVISTFAVAFRYAEVYLSTYYIGKVSFNNAHGGPMLYLSLVPGGKVLPYLFSFFCIMFACLAGSVAQSNSIGMALQKCCGLNLYVIATVIFIVTGYILVGGADRIVQLLDKLVPLKVGLFLVTALGVLLYHYQSIPGALWLIVGSAFKPESFLGGGAGFTIQQAISAGLTQGVFAHEAGLGTAGVAFGTTKGKNPVQDSIMSMLGVYICVHIICFMVGLCVIASGVWNNGSTSTALMIDSYETLYGSFGGWIISFLVINFALTVLIADAFVGKICWDFLLKGRMPFVFPVVYASLAFVGTIMDVNIVWGINGIVNAFLLAINLFGILWLLNVVKQGLQKYRQHNG